MANERRQRDAAELLALIDRFESLLLRSDLVELEVEAGDTLLRLAKPARVALATSAPAPAVNPEGQSTRGGSADPTASGLNAVLAPLTGIFYTSPAPGAAPYLKEGGPVSVGQVIGLIEAMKLFNEIKSDVAGTVHRIVVESGALVKQKQPLIEVRP